MESFQLYLVFTIQFSLLSNTPAYGSNEMTLKTNPLHYGQLKYKTIQLTCIKAKFSTIFVAYTFPICFYTVFIVLTAYNIRTKPFKHSAFQPRHTIVALPGILPLVCSRYWIEKKNTC